MARRRSSPSGGGSPTLGRRPSEGRASRPRASSSKTFRGLRSWLPGAQSFAAAEGVTVAALVTYDVMQEPGTKLPRPGPIVAAMGFYALLAAAGSVSRTFEPVFVGVGWVLTLSVLVTGKRGAGILGIVKKLAGYTSQLGGDQTKGG